MAGKRSAGTYLTDRNWDEDDEAEEAGEFKQADQSVMKQRKIKVAKRKNLEATADSGTGGAFKGFSGFTSSGAKPSFNFGGETAKPLGSLESKPLAGLDTKPMGGFGAGGFGGLSSKPFGSNLAEGKTAFGEASKAFAEKQSTAKPSADETKNGTAKHSSKYLSQLKSLNDAVSKWIKDHVDKNPYCILTPIFTDYEQHLAEIEKKHGSELPTEEKEKADGSAASNTESNKASKDDTTEKGNKEDMKKDDKTDAKSESTTSSGISFSFGTAGSNNSQTSKAPFSFGAATSATSGPLAATTSSSGSLFGSTTTTSSTFSGFSFAKTDTSAAPGGGFTFATGKPTSGTASGDAGAAGNEEDEYVPPKPETSAITEDDAFYTKRCKLFFKIKDDWKDRGVGNLFLKPCDGKTQVLMRADTSIGNILLNIMTHDSMPLSRHGKNNVMTMCIPNPPLDEKKPDDNTPVSMLLRVKTAEEADELLEKLKECKEK